jgi:glucose-6-phosphate isomerase
MSQTSLWERFKAFSLEYPAIGFSMDVSRMRFPDDFFDRMRPAAERAFAAMAELEAGAVANPDEGRMVGHYWLRNPALAPSPELRAAIESTRAAVESFAREVHSGAVAPPGGGRFTDVLVVGIGGSALGPQLVADALGGARDPMRVHFFDNTDPDGFDRVLDGLDSRLGQVLVVVISKSGGTKETRNGMLEAEARFRAKGLDFARHAVAVTGEGSELDRAAAGWLRRFPMWDWVGGRTSVMSAVGLVPMALQGLDAGAFLAGAAAMDEETRRPDPRRNAAMLLALMWHHAGNGKGERDMVILPYKDRLALFSKYLQQLVMESLGKEFDLGGNRVNQGIAVYGNKGSTDQHAYVQQLRDGVNNFFATFIEVREAREGEGIEVEPGVRSGDYLQGFLRGTRQALSEGGRESITIGVDRLDAFRLGALVALYERAVGFYASMVNVNAYHQPGVEAGKKAAARILALQLRVAAEARGADSVETLAAGLGADPEEVFHVLRHLAANAPERALREKAAALAAAAL